MMKKFYLLLLLLIVHITASAQRKADLRILHVRYGTNASNMQQMTHYKPLNYDGKTEYFFEFVLKNSGPNSILKFDTVTVFLNGTKYFTDQLVLSPGDTAVFTPTPNSLVFNIPSGKAIPNIDTFYWCDSVRIASDPINGTLLDADLSNNITCHFVDARYAWPTDISDAHGSLNELQLFPNPASTSLTIQYSLNSSAKSAGITLRNMMGSEVYYHALSNSSRNLTHAVDISHLPAGLYTAELHYDDQTVIQKFTIQ